NRRWVQGDRARLPPSERDTVRQRHVLFGASALERAPQATTIAKAHMVGRVQHLVACRALIVEFEARARLLCDEAGQDGAAALGTEPGLVPAPAVSGGFALWFH